METQTETLPQPQIVEPPAPTVTESIARPLDDAMVRQMVMEAEKSGEDVAAATVAAAQTLPKGVTDPIAAGQPPVPPAPTAPRVEVPQKFLKPDGTVDVDKLKTSTGQLNEAIQQKQQVIEKTVDDYVKEYREAENTFRNMPSNPNVIIQQAGLPPAPPPPAPAPIAPQPVQQAPQDLNAIRAQIHQDLQVDPVGTIIDLVKAVSQKEMEPITKERQAREQAEKDESMRRNLADIAAQDRRILDPAVFQAVNQEIQSDSGYKHLRNPHLAAWAVVKERLRLGTPQQQPAQPGRPPSPILGGGTPPPAPSSSGAITPQALMGAIPQAKTQQEMSAVEQQIRALMQQLDR